jgi:ribonuclease BN (tRNA processing enzyme)
VADLCHNCDILIHEVYSTAGFARRPKEWQAYHARYHTSSTQLAEIANNANPKLLVLTHQLFWGTTETDLLAEVTAHYTGKVISAHDLDIF